jgi:hypothetical protein
MTRQELKRENGELRAALELRGQRTIDEWEALPRDVRETLAARAFIAEWGDFGRALIRLGFPAMNKLPPSQVHLYKDYIARIFETPGVQEILKRDLRPLDMMVKVILQRQGEIALLHPDAATSTRAAELIAKVCKWY